MFKKYTCLLLLSLVSVAEIIMADAPAEQPMTKQVEVNTEENAVVAETSNRLALSKQCNRFASIPASFADALAVIDDAELWQRPGYITELNIEIAALVEDGLNPDHYFLPQLIEIATKASAGDRLTDCDNLLASYAFLRALKDLVFGRVDPQKAGFIWYEQARKYAEESAFLHDLAKKSIAGINAGFSAARPTIYQYKQLKKAYIEALASFPPQWIEVPGGGSLRAGDSDFRIRVLRQRLQQQGLLADAVAENSDFFDAQLLEAVLHFQRQYGLVVDGIVGKHTLAALNIQPQQLLARIRVNLERMRWLSRELEANLLLVDIAAARIEYYRAGQLAWTGLAQVGRPSRKTPGLKSRITHVTLNPNWTVPPTIFRQDKLPEIRKDPTYLQKNHIRVFNTEGQILDPSKINWNNPGAVILRQDSGADSALGLVAIRFPNPFAVYLHDTPSRNLFATPNRFYSSGCVRVENAMALTELLFTDASEEMRERFSTIRASGKTRNLNVPQTVAILMLYWTAQADRQGVIQYRPDVYNQDDKLLELL